MKRQPDAGLLVAVLLALFAVWPLLTPGLPNTADGSIHFYRAVDMQQAWRDGMLYPRWSANLALGYGTPLFNFAPPLIYLVMMVLNQIGLDLALAMKLTVVLFIFVASLGMYLLGRDTLNREAGWVAAAAYLYAPYRLRELYIQGNYAQFLGLALYPFILWAFFHVVESGRVRWIVAGGAGLAALLLSHNISAMIFAPLLAAYGGFWLILRPRWVAVRGVVLSGALGLGLGAFFWLPAFYESRWIQLSQITKGHFDFRLHFLSLSELFAPYTALDFAAVNVNLPRSLGWAMVGLAALGLAAAIWGRGLTRRQRQIIGLSVAVLGGCLFMMLPASTPLWEHVPLLKLAEFPWRILGITAVPLALAAGVSIGLLRACLPERWAAVAAPVGLLCILVPSFFYLFPRQPFVDLSGARVQDITAYELRTKAFGTTSAGEFLPLWTTLHPTDSPMVTDYRAGRPPDKIDRTSLPAGVQAQDTGRGYAWNAFRFQSDQPFTVRFNTLWFPGWQVELDGRSVDGRPQTPQGLIELPIPAGTHTVRLSFGATPPRVIGELVSALALLALLGGVALSRRPGAGQSQADAVAGAGQTTSTSASWLWSSGALLALLLVWQVGIAPLTGWFRIESPSGQVIGVQHPARVRLGDQAMFLGYDLEAAGRVTPGQAITTRVYWQASSGVKTDYRSFVHLDALTDLQTVAQSDAVHPGGIPMTTWPPSMYAQDEHSLTLPPDLPPGIYLLRAGLYDPDTGRRLPVMAENGQAAGDAVLLQGLRVERTTPLRAEALSPRSLTRFGDRIELLSATVANGQGVTATLYWRARQSIPQDYAVFVHVLDAGGHVIAQADSAPAGGRYPTSYWQPGEIVEDAHRTTLPAGAVGPFRVAVGVYDPSTLVRLEARDAQGAALPDNRLVLGE